MTKACHMWGWPIPLRLHSSTLQLFAVRPHKGFTTSPVWNKLPARPLVFRAQWQSCTFLQGSSPSPTYPQTHVCALACPYVRHMLQTASGSPAASGYTSPMYRLKMRDTSWHDCLSRWVKVWPEQTCDIDSLLIVILIRSERACMSSFPQNSRHMQQHGYML